MANATKANDTKAKASDKSVIVAEEKDKAMTNAELIAVLESVGVKPAAKAVKADLEKLFEENAAAIELMTRLPELKKACIVKAFGAHGQSKLCAKCKKKTKTVYDDCAAYEKIAGVKKAAAKKTRSIGGATGKDLWYTKKGTYAHTFCQALLDAGDKGLTHAEARKASWNPKGYPFKQTAERLLKNKWITMKQGRMFVTAAGVAESKKIAA
jgi:hypothetical protein